MGDHLGNSRLIMHDTIDAMLGFGYLIGIERDGQHVLRPTNNAKAIKDKIHNKARLLIRGGDDRFKETKILWLVVR